MARYKSGFLRFAKYFLGEQSIETLVIRRNIYFYRKFNVIFIHIPKCAGTSVSYSLYGRSLGHRTAQDIRARNPVEFAHLFKFAVMRDPLQRAYSAWSYAINGGGTDGWIRPSAEYSLPEFDTFERFATEWLPKRNVNKLDFIFRPQASFITDSDGGLIVDQLIKLEYLDSQWLEIIARCTPYIDDIAKKNRTRIGNNDSHISEAAANAIREVYSADYSLYNSIDQAA